MKDKLIVWIMFILMICLVCAYPIVPYLISRIMFLAILLDFTAIFFAVSGLWKDIFK